MATAGYRYEERTGNIWSYAHRGDMTGLKAAVVRGVDVNMVNTVGWTACHAAAAGGQSKALRYLVKKMDADLSIADKGGNFAVHHAAKNGHVHALRTLQELGADVTKVRLSQAKGKAVRECVLESYRKAGKKELEDGDEDFVEAVGYARKQSKSTAFWGPRRTPISCAIKKKIIKDKRKIRKEKQKLKHECDTQSKGIQKGQEIINSEEHGLDEPSYLETVQQIKRRRKQKRRQRQKSQTQTKQQQEHDQNSIVIGEDIPKKQNEENFRSHEKNGTVGEDNISESESDFDDNQRFISSPISQFAALALAEDDSDSE